MISSDQVLQEIQGNVDLIVKILNDFGFHNITNNNKEIRCSFTEDGNPTGVRVSVNDLRTTYYSKNIYGFYNLLIEKSNSEFLFVHELLMSYIGEIKELKPVKPLFGGFFSNMSKHNEVKYYRESDLSEYKRVASQRFYDDNIFIETQKKFDVRYDYRSNRIVIPWRMSYGELIGAIGRINRDVTDDTPKYLAMLPFNKRDFVFGLNITNKHIIDKNLVIVFEAEKSTMKSYQHGVPHVTSVGCHNISESQAKLLSRYCDRIILAYDEGVDELEIIRQTRMLKQHFKKVDYLYDTNNEFLPKGSKLSPADLPTSKYKEFMLNCLKPC